MRVDIYNATKEKLITSIDALRILYRDNELSIGLKDGFNQIFKSLKRDSLTIIEITTENSEKLQFLCSFISYNYIIYQTENDIYNVSDNTALFKVLQ